MAKSSQHDATDSAVGFYFQASYALVVLMDAADDDSVSIETRDDIELVGNNPQLRQIKHSLGTPPSLTEKNEGLWKTIGIWMPLLSSNIAEFFFVTCASIDSGDALLSMTSHGTKRETALALLEKEAARVIAEVKAAEDERKNTPNGPASQKPLPHREKGPVCVDFMNLAPTERKKLVERIVIIHGSFNATGLQQQVEARLQNYPKRLRPQMSQRLLEWWDFRAGRSLIGAASRLISKEELLDRMQSLVVELAEDNLPDDFSHLLPTDPAAGLSTLMEQQINLVLGGPSRITRSATARWRAREQRDRWINEQISLAADLKEWDQRVVESWKDRHGPMCDDCRQKTPDEKRSSGLLLLDWSHLEAFQVVPPPRPKWAKPFLVQGTFQQLADELSVGWHPDFATILKATPVGVPAKPKKLKGTAKPKAAKKAKK